MIVTQTISVHLDRPNEDTIEAVQGDDRRIVYLRGFQDGKEFAFLNNVKGLVRYSIFHEGEYYTSCYDTLPDGSQACSNYDNKLKVVLTPEIFTIPGVGQLQIGLLNGNEVTATMSIPLRVNRNLAVEGITPAIRVDLTRFIQEEVRRHISEASEQDRRLDQLHCRSVAAWLPGSLQDGQELESSTRIRTGFIPQGGRLITLTVADGVKWRCFYYDKEKQCIGQSAFYSGPATLYRDASYVRVVAGYVDNRTVSDVELLGSQVGIFFKSQDYDGCQGSVTARSYDSLTQCNAQGYYRFDTGDLTGISDAPPVVTGGILEVRPHGGDDVTYQTIYTADGEIWFRTGTNPFRRLTVQQE